MSILNKRFWAVAIAWGAGASVSLLSANPIIGTAVAIAVYVALD